jgi:peptidylprolyl isomerase/peptidyl-prolyl cis-trans isomerase B (cyclophilin B)
MLLLSLISCKTPVDLFDPDNTADASEKIDLEACYTQSHTPTEEITRYVQFTLACGATFVVELYPEAAPETVAHFQQLVADHYYDGLTFYRVWKNFCIYGGEPRVPENEEDAIAPIPGEFANNGFTQNTLNHKRGTISMWHDSADPDSATTRFFIMQKDSTTCDGKFAAFGRVIYGMETIDAIANIALTEELPSNNKTKPIAPPVIRSITFVTLSDADAPQ